MSGAVMVAARWWAFPLGFVVFTPVWWLAFRRYRKNTARMYPRDSDHT